MRRRILVEGQVQGVGFRPFVQRVAVRLGLAGYVRNGPPGVVIEVEGSRRAVDAFRSELLSSPPPGAVLERVEASPLEPRGARGFQIRTSQEGAPGHAAIAPDLATCPDCLAELRDPTDRRAHYPFLNCTHCGPRFTIVRSAPYDRHRTTMDRFPLCADCGEEYRNPADRRFHAQAVACPTCGPSLRLLSPSREPAREGSVDPAPDAAPFRATAEALRDGRVVAIKGLGGFHLACDARNGEAVARLRKGKDREGKPLAIMVRDVDAARTLCRVGTQEEALLRSPRAPIVLLPRRPDAPVASGVAPGLRRLGLMLPNTPLHHLLLDAFDGPLVLTSGNRSGEVLAHRDEDARERLSAVAELFLTHDRPIHVPCDDSVLLPGPEGTTVPIRRSRGYVPEPLRLPAPLPRPVLALGGHLKTTFAVAQGTGVVLSQHLGDMDDLSTREALMDGVAHLCHLAGVTPEVVAHDMHPDYPTTRLAQEWERTGGLRRRPVQHHHAHALSCLAEHGGLDEPALAVVFDGSGHGSDGAVWGGEFLEVGPDGWRRRGHLAYRPLPGGDAAVREPWRMAAAHLEGALRNGGAEAARSFRAFRDIPSQRWDPVLDLIRSRAQKPMTSSVGRLFDGAAALLGLRRVSAYEGQAAMELEAAADPRVERSYPAPLREGAAEAWTWDPAPLFEGMATDLRRGRSAREIGGAFHNAVRDAITGGCRRLREETGIRTVALSGGAFQNVLLLAKTIPALRAAGFTPLVHHRVPPNDGGLSLGQAAAVRDIPSPPARTEE